MSEVLLVDDDKDFCDAVSQMLSSLGHTVAIAHSVEAALALVTEVNFDHAVLDFMLPDGSGLHIIDAFKMRTSSPLITLVSGHPAVKNIISGLCDDTVNCLIKPVKLAQIKSALDLAPTRTHRVAETEGLHYGCLVGESQPMQRLYEMIARVGKTSANVLLMGESGVGKELVARAIHQAGDTPGALVAANCGALSRELIGSELFGHEKGAFTGANARKIGLFEQAEKGTLFLDEITEMPIDMQPNLLRVLETNQVTRLGATKEIPVNCRVISATNRSAQQLGEAGLLREDLYFRLAVFPIHIPALRNRPGDIPLLAKTFLAQLNAERGTKLKFSQEQIDQLLQYRWHGNVRELRHAIHRAFIMSNTTAEFISLPSELASPFGAKDKYNDTVAAGQTIDNMEKGLIKATLSQLDGNKPLAAEMLGISLKTLYNRLNKYSVNEEP